MLSLKVAKTLFEVLKSRQVDISKDLLDVYRLAAYVLFDDYLKITSLFFRDTSL